MSDGYFMPKNVFRGTDSNGTSYNIVEWDFATIATMDLFGTLIMLIAVFALASIIGPILLILLLLSAGTNGRWLYLVPLVISTYVIYDFTHRWLSAISASFFANDVYMNHILTANIITFIISFVFSVFGSLLNGFVFKPVSHLTEDEYNKLKVSEKKKLSEKVETNKAYVIALVILLYIGGMIIGKEYQKSNPNWMHPTTQNSE